SSANGNWNKKYTIKLFEKNGDIFLSDILKGKVIQLTSTVDRESSPVFSGDESRVLFIRNDNLYSIQLNSGELIQLTTFVRSTSTSQAAPSGRRGHQNNDAKMSDDAASDQAKWLKDQQLELFDIIKEKDKTDKLNAADRKLLQPKKLKEINVDDKRIRGLQLSPNGRYTTYRLITPAKG